MSLDTSCHCEVPFNLCCLIYELLAITHLVLHLITLHIYSLEYRILICYIQHTKGYFRPCLKVAIAAIYLHVVLDQTHRISRILSCTVTGCYKAVVYTHEIIGIFTAGCDQLHILQFGNENILIRSRQRNCVFV